MTGLKTQPVPVPIVTVVALAFAAAFVLAYSAGQRSRSNKLLIHSSALVPVYQ